MKSGTQCIHVGDKAQPGTYKLWLSCGHSGGQADAGSVATRRKCRECQLEGYKRVVRVELVPHE